MENGLWFAQQAQRQDSLSDQLRDLLVLANRMGMYDAFDWLSQRMDEAGISA